MKITSSFGYMHQREESRRLNRRISELDAQCQKHEANWRAVSECLCEIEKDVEARQLCVEPVQRARQCVNDCLELPTKVFKLQSVGNWLFASDFKSSVNHILLVVYLRKRCCWDF